MDYLLRRIEAFLRRSLLSATAFGLAATNDDHLVQRLRAGKTVRGFTRKAILEFIKKADAADLRALTRSAYSQARVNYRRRANGEKNGGRSRKGAQPDR